MNIKQAWEQRLKEKIYCKKCKMVTLHEIIGEKKSCLRCKAIEFGQKVEENKKGIK